MVKNSFLDRKKIELRAISDEMKESYLDYAMSVIVSRALPDVRDGLKPVHRRILYSMWKMGLDHSGKFRKSAAIVGEVMAKFHPHGDVAIYDSLVRMAQDFSFRYPLIKGQGNFGSIDGDPPAAMRYSEAKLTKISEEILKDLEKETVEFEPNYDNSSEEPKVLPAKLPNFLINGTMGIAVGMMTDIPPHNIKEVIDGLIYFIDHPESSIKDLVKFIKGPDFPTGGIILNQEEVEKIYFQGKGKILLRAKTDIEKDEKGFRIIVREIPFRVNKAELIKKIANLVKDKKIEGIKDLRDESDKEGIRINIELKKEVSPQRILKKLFSLTPLEDTFHVNMVGLWEGIQPRLLNLKEILEGYLNHRKIVIRKRTEFDLEKTKNRVHILKGLLLALKNIDQVIKTIKASKNREEALKNLIKKFRLTKIQGEAILEMKLQTLASLEREKIDKEYQDLIKKIGELEIILKDPKKISQKIKDELIELKKEFGDERKTEIIFGRSEETIEKEEIPQEETLIFLTKDGYIKRLNSEIFKIQERGGKGVLGFEIKEKDEILDSIFTSTEKDLLFFSNKGRVYRLKAIEIPSGSRISKGEALVNFLSLAQEEKITAVLADI